MEIEKEEHEKQTPSHENEDATTRNKGGLRTMPFIISNETFEKVAGLGLHVNMIIYLQNEYHMSSVTGANVLFLWSAVSNFMPILGAFISDSYLGRYRVILLGTITSLLGMIALWLTAIIPGARPKHCNTKAEDISNCAQAKAGHLLFLLSSFMLMSIGAGGIRPCSLAFGADQINNPKNPRNKIVLQSFFNWYYASVGVSYMISVIVIVAIQDAAGWIVGLGVPVGLMFLSTIFFVIGSPLYVKVQAHKSLFTGFAQVISAAWKRKQLELPPIDSGRWYYQRGSNIVVPSDRLRFFNKGCIITNLEEDLDSEGFPKNPWNICTVKKVEELKAVIRVLPIWSTGIIVSATISQHAFPVLQAKTMNRHFIGKAKIPAASFGVFGILTLTIWVAIYDRLLVPLLSKLTKRPRGLNDKQRMGIGLIISCLATAVAGLVEHKRRGVAAREGLVNNSRAALGMSAMWLIPQHCLTGLAEALNAIGQIEFYYSQFPKTMSSIAVALFALGMALGNLVGSLIVTIVDRASKVDGNVSWVSSNLNRGHYDYYYWVLSGLSVVNFFYYLLCSRAYGSCEDNKIWDEEKVLLEGEESVHGFASPLKLASGL